MSSFMVDSDEIEIARLRHRKKMRRPAFVRAVRRASSLGLHAKKFLYQVVRRDKDLERRVLFIVGCQRSGTTMMTELFERDPDAIVFSEHSRLSSRDKQQKLRLNPLPSVKRALDGCVFPLVVLKPLVEAHKIKSLLDYFPNSSALWMYRNYRDVAKSDLRQFGIYNGIRNLKFIVKHQPGDWRSEGVSDDVRSTILKFYNDRLDAYEAAALFWYARNRLYFELNLNDDARIQMCRYETLVEQPSQEMESIYQFIGRKHPSEGEGVAAVHDRSVGSGQAVTLRPEIDDLCHSLWEKLNEADALQRQARSATSKSQA